MAAEGAGAMAAGVAGAIEAGAPDTLMAADDDGGEDEEGEGDWLFSF